MKVLRTTKAAILLVILFTGCYYDVEEEIYPTIDCDTEDMSYTDDILPIIDMECYVCHSAAANFGNVTLEGYSELKNYVDNGALLGTVQHASGYSPMPKNRPQILDCEIEKIEAWINSGAPNN